jgi:hypothetical protein
MLDGTAHWRPLVNGDSGFMPRPYTREMELLTAPGGEDALRLLRAIDVRHVVAREAFPARRLRGRGGARLRGAFRSRRRRAVAGEAVPTVWTSAGVIADLGRAPRRVRRVRDVGRALGGGARGRGLDDGVSWTPVAARASLADATLSLLRDPRHGVGR